MPDNLIAIFLRDFVSAWQVAKIYEVEHPRFQESVAQALESLKELFKERKEIIIGVVGSEFACGEDIFFELSKKLGPAIAQLKERGVERIIFQDGIIKEELAQFIALLVSQQAEVKKELKDYLPIIGIKNIRVGKIGDLDTQVYLERPEDKTGRYDDCLDKVSQSLDSLVNEDAVDFLKVKFVTNTVMDNLLGNYQMFARVSQIKTYDTLTFRHLLNVSILSIYFAHKLGLSRDDCLDIGTAALLHDIGKLFISRKIIRKTDKLKEEEIEAVKSHTFLGAEILLRHTDTLGILPAIVAFEHHLGWDGEGYPKITPKRKPHLASLIVTICDEYDALTQRRSYKRDYPPELVYQIMNRQKGAKFSFELLEMFFKVIGIWPKGTIVALSDSRIAVVKEVNEDDLYRPQVQIISASPREVIDLRQVPALGIKKSLNPLTEGKQYLEQNP